MIWSLAGSKIITYNLKWTITPQYIIHCCYLCNTSQVRLQKEIRIVITKVDSSHVLLISWSSTSLTVSKKTQLFGGLLVWNIQVCVATRRKTRAETALAAHLSGKGYKAMLETVRKIIHWSSQEWMPQQFHHKASHVMLWHLRLHSTRLNSITIKVTFICSFITRGHLSR